MIAVGTGSVRWLDDSVGRPKIIAMRVENLNRREKLTRLICQ
jgi:hypothetical protein